MSNIHIVTDSGCDLPAAVRERLSIKMVPLTVRFGDEIFLDGVDITPEQFYNKLSSEKVMPSTSQPSPADFVKIYRELAQPGDTIFSIHLSSEMSGTYQSAVLAATMLESGIDVQVIDTKTASLGIGVVAAAAAEAVLEGKTVPEVQAAIEGVMDSMVVYFVVDTLEYLQKNGRIGLASALVGTLLSIKPVLTVKEGMVAPFEKIRGKNKALSRIKVLAEEFKAQHPQGRLKAAVSHADNYKEAVELASYVEEKLALEQEAIIGCIGSTIGVHTGAGTVALFLYLG